MTVVPPPSSGTSAGGCCSPLAGGGGAGGGGAGGTAGGGASSAAGCGGDVLAPTVIALGMTAGREVMAAVFGGDAPSAPLALIDACTESTVPAEGAGASGWRLVAVGGGGWWWLDVVEWSVLPTASASGRAALPVVARAPEGAADRANVARTRRTSLSTTVARCVGFQSSANALRARCSATPRAASWLKARSPHPHLWHA